MTDVENLSERNEMKCINNQVNSPQNQLYHKKLYNSIAQSQVHL